jgi:2-polyprenyl-3-methyl-5-hydroxy-6-metoxy-1,4-benzoquinol methylase
MRLTDRQFWEHHWQVRAARRRSEAVRPRRMPFHALLAKTLPRGGSFVEVGCAPGRNMAYFHRYFGYRVAGIDYAGEDITRRTLDENGVGEYRLYRMDFLEELPAERFDVVASFGLLEHFTRLEEVLARHVRMLNPGGYLVVGVPNYRWGQYLIRLALDRVSLRRHNLEAMKRGVIRRLLTRLGAREVLYCGHYRTFGIWLDREDAPGALVRGVGLLDAGFQRLAGLLRLDNVPNRFLSPYLVAIARF